MSPRPTEQQLAALVVEHLQRWQWRVYEEVPCFGCYADIVGISPMGHAMIVEVKASASIAVLDQAWEWTRSGISDWVCVATPKPRSRFFFKALDVLGAGLLQIEPPLHGDGPDDGWRPPVSMRVAPTRVRRLHKSRRFTGSIVECCHDELEAGGEWASAGSQAGRRRTPWACTVRDLARIVARAGDDGLSVRDAVDRLDHHYSSDKVARASLLRCIREGLVAGVEADDSARPLVLRPALEA